LESGIPHYPTLQYRINWACGQLLRAPRAQYTDLMKIRVGPEDYTIQLSKDITDDGDFSAVKKLIRIRRGSSHTLSTAFHELFHAELHESSFDTCEVWNEGVEEILVDILSRSVARNYDKILAFLKKNKQKL